MKILYPQLPQPEALEKSLGSDVYRLLIQRVQGDIVVQNRETERIVSAVDAWLPFLALSLVTLPPQLCAEEDWLNDFLKRWHDCRHPSLWRFERLIEHDGKVCLLGPRMQGTSLDCQERAFGVVETIKFLMESLSLLEQIHNSGAVFGSLQPKDIFWEKHVQFIDIGSTYALAKRSYRPGMPLDIDWEYQAAEVFLTGQITAAADIYALGMITWEAILGERFQKGDDTASLMEWHQNFAPRSLQLKQLGFPDLAIDVLMAMCSKAVDSRMTASVARKTLQSIDLSVLVESTEPDPVLTFSLSHLSFDMQRIAAGRFIMGGKDEDGEYDSDDLPAHHVNIHNDFLMGTVPVIQELYALVMENNPSRFSKDAGPVESVSWIDAVRFCNALSEKLGYEPYYQIVGEQVVPCPKNKGFRLPTEAEWEYAALAGGNTKYAGGDNMKEVGLFQENRSFFGPVAVGSYQPNAWGIYDMSGNVMEWCFDGYDEYSAAEAHDPMGEPDEQYKIIRGGSWNRYASSARAKRRSRLHQSVDTDFVGFRIVIDI